MYVALRLDFLLAVARPPHALMSPLGGYGSPAGCRKRGHAARITVGHSSVQDDVGERRVGELNPRNTVSTG